MIITYAALFFYIKSSFSGKFNPIIFACSKKYGVDGDLIISIIKAESDFDENATSVMGAQGLMQVMPETADYVCEKYGLFRADLYDPSFNIECGTAYLQYLFKRFSDKKTVVAAYNAGEGTVRRWISEQNNGADGALKRIEYRETERYVKKVIFLEKILKNFKNSLDIYE